MEGGKAGQGGVCPLSSSGKRQIPCQLELRKGLTQESPHSNASIIIYGEATLPFWSPHLNARLKERLKRLGLFSAEKRCLREDAIRGV